MGQPDAMDRRACDVAMVFGSCTVPLRQLGMQHLGALQLRSAWIGAKFFGI